MNTTKKMLAEMAKLTPETGFNLIGYDDYGKPEDQGLFFIDNFPTKGEADAEKAKRELDSPGQAFYVYGPKTP